MTIDNKVEQLPLFIKGVDFRFDGDATFFYFNGVQKSIEGIIPDCVLYTAQKSQSTYSLKSLTRYAMQNPREWIYKARRL